MCTVIGLQELKRYFRRRLLLLILNLFAIFFCYIVFVEYINTFLFSHFLKLVKLYSIPIMAPLKQKHLVVALTTDVCYWYWCLPWPKGKPDHLQPLAFAYLRASNWLHSEAQMQVHLSHGQLFSQSHSSIYMHVTANHSLSKSHFIQWSANWFAKTLIFYRNWNNRNKYALFNKKLYSFIL